MSSLPAVSRSSSPVVPPPPPAPQGNARTERLEDAPAPSAAPMPTLNGTPSPNANSLSGSTSTVSTISPSLVGVSASLNALGFTQPSAKTSRPKKAPAIGDPSAPFVPPRNTPPPTATPTLSAADTPVTATTSRKRRNPYAATPEQIAALTLVAFHTQTRLIVNKDATTIAIIPNGSTADAARSLFQIRSKATKFTFILMGVGDATEAFFTNYFTVNKRPDIPPTTEISVHSGIAILKYDTKEEWDLAAKHRWSIGKPYLPGDFDPTREYDYFYRACFAGADFSRLDNLDPRLKAYFTSESITITSASVTRNREIMQAYFFTDVDWRNYEDLRLEMPLFILPAFGRDEHDTPFRALPALTATNNPSYVRLFVGNVSAGAEEYLVRERFRVAAEEGGFSPKDVITFGAYRYPGSTKTSRYGYLFVHGADLAKYLVEAKIDTADGIFEVALSQEDSKPRDKKQKKK